MADAPLNPPPAGFSLDVLLPPAIARKAEDLGVAKAGMDALSTFVLAVLAGAFIGLGAMFFTVVTTAAAGDVALPYGIARLIGGLAFCLGLILVVLAGAELFTGNNLIVMAWASGKISLPLLLRNWLIVYAGNFAGALATAALVTLSGQHRFASGALGAQALAIATGKLAQDWPQAVALGVLCNALVCLAIWLTMGARTTTDKILAILFPITAFVAAGFEHSVANMYFVPAGLWIAGDADYLAGAGLVGLVYWFVYLRGRPV